ncbi:MAG: tetratricopeptide repeat protein [Thermoplasmata archaeon]|nr:tetratricopeptide repeat protein [Thermoplasmata archaeon]
MMKREVFVGREEELGEMENIFSEVLDSRGRTVFVTGPAGIGKTHLVEEFLSLHPEARSLTARASIDDPPYETVIMLLRKYAETDRHHLEEGEKEFFKDAIKRIKEIERTILSPAGGEESDPERLFSQVEDIFLQISEHVPLVLVVDDIHYCDASSLSLFERLKSHTAEARIMAIGIYREEEVGEDHPLRKMVEDGVEVLVVPPLGALDILEMVERIMDVSDISTQFIKRLYRETGGNPLFVREVLRAVMENENVDRSKPYWYAEIDLGSMPLPSSLKEIVLSRLRTISGEEKSVLRYASCLGSKFSSRVLEKALAEGEGMGPGKFKRALENLKDSKLIREEGSGVFHFVYPEAVELVYRDIEDVEKTHETLARVMEEMGGDVYSIARQYSLAGNMEKAWEFEEKSGDRAMQSLAPIDARGHYDNAIESLEALAKGKKGKKGRKTKAWQENMMRLLIKRGNAFNMVGEVESALEDYKNAYSTAEKLKDEKALALISRKMGDVYRTKSMWDEAREMYEKGYDMCESMGDPVGVAECLRGLGYISWRRGEFDAAIERYSKALKSAEEGKDASLIGAILIEFGNVYNEKGELEKALKYYLKSVDILTKTKNLGELARAYNNIGDTYLQLRQWSNAVAFFKKTGAVAEKIGNKTMMGWALFNASEALAKGGEPEKAIKYAEGALRILEKIGDTIGLSGVYKGYGIAYRVMGKYEAAEENFKKALDFGEKSHSPYTLAEILLETGVLYKEKKDDKKAEEHLKRAEKLAEDIGARVLLSRIKKVRGG